MSPLWKLSFLKIVVSLVMGLTGWIVVGPFLNLLLTGEGEWPTTKPLSFDAAIAGVILGGTLVGRKVGFVGWSILIGTVAGTFLGSRLENKATPPWTFIGFITGSTLGAVVGVLFELKHRDDPEQNRSPV